MSVNYSLVLRAVNPGDAESQRKVYPVAQMAKQVTLRDIAKHIHDHGSPFSVGTIVGLLMDAVECMTENLKEGNRVDMDTMGDFYLTLSSEGAANANEFNPQSMIKHINLRWRCTSEMDRALQGIGYNYMPNLDELAEAKRASKAKLNQELGILEDGDEPEPGGEGGGSDEPDPGVTE